MGNGRVRLVHTTGDTVGEKGITRSIDGRRPCPNMQKLFGGFLLFVVGQRQTDGSSFSASVVPGICWYFSIERTDMFTVPY